MATFTMTLSEIMDGYGVDTIDDATLMPSIFGLDKYPIFDDAYRDELNRKIIARFWNREIGHETEEMFRMRMDTRMREIMVEKNQLYQSELIKFNPMHTIDIKTDVNETATGTLAGTTTANQDTTDQIIGKTTNDVTTSGQSDTTTSGTSDVTTDMSKDTTAGVESDSTSTKDAKSRAVSSVMPQNQLSGNGDYADSAQDSVSDGSDTSHSETDTTSNETNAGTVGTVDSGLSGTIESGTSLAEENETTNRTGTNDQTGTVDSATTDSRDRTSTTVGYQAMPAQLLQQFRDTILNIDLQILTDLERLFMSVTSNGDEVFYTQDQSNYYPYFNGFGFF